MRECRHDPPGEGWSTESRRAVPAATGLSPTKPAERRGVSGGEPATRSGETCAAGRHHDVGRSRHSAVPCACPHPTVIRSMQRTHSADTIGHWLAPEMATRKSSTAPVHQAAVPLCTGGDSEFAPTRRRMTERGPIAAQLIENGSPVREASPPITAWRLHRAPDERATSPTAVRPRTTCAW
jgi:hypothetical protein